MSDIPNRLSVRVSPPAVEPLSVAEVKTFLRIDGDHEDTILATLIASARIIAEQIMGKSLITQSWKLAYDEVDQVCVKLSHLPLQSVVSVVAVDALETSTTVSAMNYYINAARDGLVFDVLPSGRRVEITYLCGFGDEAADVPADIRQAMLVHVAQLYEQRDSQTLPQISEQIYIQHREVRV